MALGLEEEGPRAPRVLLAARLGEIAISRPAPISRGEIAICRPARVDLARRLGRAREVWREHDLVRVRVRVRGRGRVSVGVRVEAGVGVGVGGMGYG